MTLEATMILMDNSNWARNGDYFPTRWDAQIDVAEKVCEVKINSNPENTVGLITMGGNNVDVLLTPAVKEKQRILSSLHDVQLKGNINFTKSLNIAQLALKHRQNTTQRQRIVAFVASPVEEDQKQLESLAKKLKKENIAVDIVLIGSRDQQLTEKLNRFITTINKENNSSLREVQPTLDGKIVDNLTTSGFFGDFNPNAYEGNFDQDVDEELQRILKESEITAAQEKQQRDEEARRLNQQENLPAVQQPNSNQEQLPQQQQDQQTQQQQMQIEANKELIPHNNQNNQKDDMQIESNNNQDQNQLKQNHKEEKIVEEARQIANNNDTNPKFQDPKFLEDLFKETGINLDTNEISQVLDDLNQQKDKKQDPKDQDPKDQDPKDPKNN